MDSRFMSFVKTYQAEEHYQKVSDKIAENETVMMDVTEREVQRDKYEQNEFYSGKKKTHTVKNLLIVSMIGLVLFCSRTEQNRIHDKVLAERIELRKSVTCIADLGFCGLNKAYMNLTLPHKKPEGKPLSENQLSENQLLNRKRVTIEHVIGKIKVLRILKDKIRNHKKDFKHLVMKLGVQLYNFKLINALSFCS